MEDKLKMVNKLQGYFSNRVHRLSISWILAKADRTQRSLMHKPMPFFNAFTMKTITVQLADYSR